jgi:hypothetical protein
MEAYFKAFQINISTVTLYFDPYGIIFSFLPIDLISGRSFAESIEIPPLYSFLGITR